MNNTINGEYAKKVLAEGVPVVTEPVAQAMDNARPGRVIDDNEELVREAVDES